MQPYIDILRGDIMCWNHHRLSERDLQFIGEFTRENISRWLDRGTDESTESFHFDLGVYGWGDFHAVCGDIEIPWAKEESRLRFANWGKPN